jgi:hypothetical protein
MNRVSGKTLSEAYVEIDGEENWILSLIPKFQGKILKGRTTSVTISCQRDLCRAIFPHRYTPEGEKSLEFLGRNEINGILAICKNYKVIFAFKNILVPNLTNIVFF